MEQKRCQTLGDTTSCRTGGSHLEEARSSNVSMVTNSIKSWGLCEFEVPKNSGVPEIQTSIPEFAVLRHLPMVRSSLKTCTNLNVPFAKRADIIPRYTSNSPVEAPYFIHRNDHSSRTHNPLLPFCSLSLSLAIFTSVRINHRVLKGQFRKLLTADWAVAGWN